MLIARWLSGHATLYAHPVAPKTGSDKGGATAVSKLERVGQPPLRLREANRQQQSRADREREDAPHDHFSARPGFAGFGSKLAFNKLGTLSLNFVIHFPN